MSRRVGVAHWMIGIQEYRNTGIQEYRNTGIQEYRNTRMPAGIMSFMQKALALKSNSIL